MATYKVIQDIEAEDKLIAWMTPRQTIYAAIVVVSGFISFLLTINNAWWLAIFLLPHMVLFSVLAGPFMHDQPSEVWLLAKIQFFLKPRRRIWDQSGLKDLVSITVPKRVERQLTDGLTQGEVRSRLRALANTIDSRGWAVKNVNVNLYAQPGYAVAGLPTDRLIDTSALPQEVPNYEVTAQDDILDERSNPTAQHLQQMIEQSSQTRRQQIMAQMQNPTAQTSQQTQQADYWFLNSSAGQQAPQKDGFATFDHSQTVMPGSVPQNAAPTPQATTQPDEQALLDKIKSDKKRQKPGKSHLRTIKTLAEQQAEQAESRAKELQSNPAIAQLATNDDLNVATIARQANKALRDSDDGEVVISLR